MPSQSRAALDLALADVDQQIAHAKSFTGGRKGAPPTVNGAKRPGRPFTRGGTVLLAGALEGFIEALALETGEKLLTRDQLKDLTDAAGRSHGANVHHIHSLFAALGLPFILDTITWQNQTNVRQLVKDLSRRRNQIAHGKAPKSAQLKELQALRRQVSNLADKLDAATRDHVAAETGTRPW